MTEPTRRDRSAWKTLPHGTVGCYTNHGCSCEACKEAWRQNQAGYRDRHPERHSGSGKLKREQS